MQKGVPGSGSAGGAGFVSGRAGVGVWSGLAYDGVGLA